MYPAFPEGVTELHLDVEDQPDQDLLSKFEEIYEFLGEEKNWSVYVIDIAWDRVFYEIYRLEHEGELPCILHKTRGFLAIIMCFISRRPLTYLIINRKELLLHGYNLDNGI